LYLGHTLLFGLRIAIRAGTSDVESFKKASTEKAKAKHKKKQATITIILNSKRPLLQVFLML
jgi:hypothetical protein